MNAEVTRGKGYKGVAMEGSIARRYAKLRGTPVQIAEYRTRAAQLTAGLPDGARILEVAPGPGFFAIELARAGKFRVTALDISRTFVEIARENARKAGVEVEFRWGDASRMDLAENSFDRIFCDAAFKNFRRPGDALNEMHRVLAPGGTAVILDLNKDAPDSAIRAEVAAMGLGWFASLMTRRILGGLRRRAYTPGQFTQLAVGSRFGGGQVTLSGIGIEVRLTKRPAST